MELLKQAVNLLATSRARLEHTRTLVDLGAALRRTNRRADARDPLRRALGLADQGGGMRLLAARACHEIPGRVSREFASTLHCVKWDIELRANR